MPISTKVKNKLMDAINTTLGSIGREPSTRPPRTKSNAAPTAWEYFVATHILAQAAARVKQAKEAAIAAGIIADEGYPAGTDELIYSGEQIGIHLTVAAPTKRIDPAKLCLFLAKRGVSQEDLTKAVEHATSQSKPAHRFKSFIQVSDVNGE